MSSGPSQTDHESGGELLAVLSVCCDLASMSGSWTSQVCLNASPIPTSGGNGSGFRNCCISLKKVLQFDVRLCQSVCKFKNVAIEASTWSYWYFEEEAASWGWVRCSKGWREASWGIPSNRDWGGGLFAGYFRESSGQHKTMAVLGKVILGAVVLKINYL